MRKLVWGTRPTSSIDMDTAAWLAPFVTGQKTTKAMRRLAQELAAEAEQGGFTLPFSALNGVSGDIRSAQAGVESQPLAA